MSGKGAAARTLLAMVQQSSDGAAYSELLAFVAVAEERSFTRAGIRLGRDATVLSRRVAALEARLGARLLERTTRAVALTEAGARFLDRAQAIVQAMNDAELEAGDLRVGEPRGHLRLALPGTFGRMWLAPLLTEFLLAHRRVSVEADFSNRFVDVVGERFDLAVRIGPLPDTRLVARKLCDRRRLLCAAPTYVGRHGPPQDPADLAHHPCLLFDGAPGPRWELEDAQGSRRQVHVAGPLVTDDLEALLGAAVAGLSILLSSEWLLAPAIRAGRLVRVLPGWTLPDAGAIYAVTPSGTRHASKTRAFADALVERLREPPWLQG